jgi:ABC-2 type transport system ATP-binding protein
MPVPAAVRVDNVSFQYGDRAALRGVSFEVARGEIFGLLGPNGGGKTTLFRILSTLLLPAGGSAHLFDIDIRKDPLAVRRRIGVVFQSQSLDRRLSVEENLGHQGRLYGLGGAVLKSRIDEVLEQTGIADRRRDVVDALSGGLRRRVELAKGLLHQPELLLLDEPSTGVDPAVRLEFWSHLLRLRRDCGTTILLTTHILEDAEKCDRLAILDNGSIVASGSPDELKGVIGGDVITLASEDPGGLAADLLREFEIEAQVVEGTVRFEHESGPETVARLMHRLPPTVSSVTVSRPTLEDVFIHATGRRFGEGEAA